MFKCKICGQCKTGASAVRVTTSTREKDYPARKNAHPRSSGRRDDPGGHGNEIVSEVVVHADCLDKFRQNNPPANAG